MSCRLKNHGFSLTEVLIAVGILAVGMTFIAGVFPVAIYLTTVATERTIAAAAADEAFAKVRLYAIGDTGLSDDIDLSELGLNELTDFNDVNAFPATAGIEPNEFAYPSAGDIAQKQYFWSALCRRAGPQLVQVTVFVSRKVSPNFTYPGGFDRPMPIEVGISATDGDNELTITDSGEKTYINDGYTIVDNVTGHIYRVLERYRDDPGTALEEDATVLLDRNWLSGTGAGDVWVVPPPVTGGRGPCIAVYQRIIGF